MAMVHCMLKIDGSEIRKISEFKSTKKLFFFFFNIHMRISMVEILSLV